MGEPPFIHHSADVAPSARIGGGTRIWHGCQVREGATIGRNCVLGKDVYVDADVVIGDNVKIQNGALLYRGVTLEDGVFVGPGAVFTNDRHPRAVTPDGSPKREADWSVVPTRVGTGASVGANATIVCGVNIGRWALIGAGAVVTTDVPDHALVYGNPARVRGCVCLCGEPLGPAAHGGSTRCSRCGFEVPAGWPSPSSAERGP